jgi:hypothetical protein
MVPLDPPRAWFDISVDHLVWVTSQLFGSFLRVLSSNVSDSASWTIPNGNEVFGMSSVAATVSHELKTSLRASLYPRYHNGHKTK